MIDFDKLPCTVERDESTGITTVRCELRLTAAEALSDLVLAAYRGGGGAAVDKSKCVVRDEIRNKVYVGTFNELVKLKKETYTLKAEVVQLTIENLKLKEELERLRNLSEPVWPEVSGVERGEK